MSSSSSRTEVRRIGSCVLSKWRRSASPKPRPARLADRARAHAGELLARLARQLQDPREVEVGREGHILERALAIHLLLLPLDVAGVAQLDVEDAAHLDVERQDLGLVTGHVLEARVLSA